MSNLYVAPCGCKYHFGEAKEIDCCLDNCKHQDDVCLFENLFELEEVE